MIFGNTNFVEKRLKAAFQNQLKANALVQNSETLNTNISN